MVLFFCSLDFFLYCYYLKQWCLFTTSRDLLLWGYGFSKGEEAVFPHPAGDLIAIVNSRSIGEPGGKAAVIPLSDMFL